MKIEAPHVSLEARSASQYFEYCRVSIWTRINTQSICADDQTQLSVCRDATLTDNNGDKANKDDWCPPAHESNVSPGLALEFPSWLQGLSWLFDDSPREC